MHRVSTRPAPTTRVGARRRPRALARAVGAVGGRPPPRRPAAPRSPAAGVPAAHGRCGCWDVTDAAATVDLATARGISQLFAAVPPDVTTSTALPRLQQLAAIARCGRRPARRARRRPGLGRQAGSGWSTNWLQAGRSPPGCSPASTSTSSRTPPPPGAPTRQGRRHAATWPPSTTLRTAAGRPAARGRHPVLVPPGRRAARGPPWTARSCKRTGAVTRDGLPQHRRPGPDGTLGRGRGRAGRGAPSLGRPVRIGQETNDLGTDPTAAKQTFAGMTVSQMQQQLTAVERGRGRLAHLRRDRHPRRGRASRDGPLNQPSPLR